VARCPEWPTGGRLVRNSDKTRTTIEPPQPSMLHRWPDEHRRDDDDDRLQALEI
jgi:hypothetical protein